MHTLQNPDDYESPSCQVQVVEFYSVYAEDCFLGTCLQTHVLFDLILLYPYAWCYNYEERIRKLS